MPDREWTDSLARQVIVEAVYGDLLKVLPGAFTPDLFGEAGARRQIASVIAKWVETANPGARPGAGVLNELIARDMAIRSEAEQVQIADEWAAIQATEPDEDPGFVVKEVREWVEFQRMRQALVAAREAMDRENGLEDARDILARVEPVRERSNEPTEYRYLAEARERFAMWAEGEPRGERVPTGLPVFDRSTGGGPAKGETWYFLAPPKGGKTTFLLTVAKGASIAGKGVYINTFEDQALGMMTRIDQMNARATEEELAGMAETDESLKNLRRAIQGWRTSGAGEIIATRRRTRQKGSVRAVIADINRLRRAGAKIDMVVLDYLNLMGGATTNERELRHELFAISYEIADMAKDLDVLVWSASLVKREAVDKVPIRKTDIAEAFGVIAALNGAVAICAAPILIQNNLRRLYMAAARRDKDERVLGDYRVNLEKCLVLPIGEAEAQKVDQLLEQASLERARRRRPVAAGGIESGRPAND